MAQFTRKQFILEQMQTLIMITRQLRDLNVVSYFTEPERYLLGKEKRSGISSTSNILARSATGPRITTGLMKSAEKENKQKNTANVNKAILCSLANQIENFGFSDQ